MKENLILPPVPRLVPLTRCF